VRLIAANIAQVDILAKIVAAYYGAGKLLAIIWFPPATIADLFPGLETFIVLAACTAVPMAWAGAHSRIAFAFAVGTLTALIVAVLGLLDRLNIESSLSVGFFDGGLFLILSYFFGRFVYLSLRPRHLST
jgi:hypothetical protein